MKCTHHHFRRMAATIATLALALTAAVIPPASAASGDLDATFGTNGITITEFSAPSLPLDSLPDVATATLIQPDGKIVVAGRAEINLPAVGGTSQIAVARYNANGTLDTTFDGDGRVTVSVASAPGVNLPRDIDIQADGKLLVAGMAGPNEQTASAVLIRFNSNGTLDTTFDTDGIVELNTSAGLGNGFRGVAVQPDGKIVCAGAAGQNALVARFNTNGTLDTSFGASGSGWVIPAINLIVGSHFLTSSSTPLAASTPPGSPSLPLAKMPSSLPASPLPESRIRHSISTATPWSA